MVLLITCTVSGIFAVVVALSLQFSLPGWLFFTGLHRAPSDKLSRIDLERLRRRLSLIFYFLAAGFFACALFLYMRLLPASLALPLLVALVAVSFDLVWLVYRRMDSNEYSDIVHRSGRVYFGIVNVVLVVLLILSVSVR
jgi:hypothetical protein